MSVPALAINPAFRRRAPEGELAAQEDTVADDGFDLDAAVDMDMDAADLDAFDVPDPGEDDLGGEA